MLPTNAHGCPAGGLRLRALNFAPRQNFFEGGVVWFFRHARSFFFERAGAGIYGFTRGGISDGFVAGYCRVRGNFWRVSDASEISF